MTDAPAPQLPMPRQPAPRVVFATVPWRRVGLFILISYGLFALFAAPFWFLPGGIHSPLYTPGIAVGMWMPAVASIIMAKGVEKTSWLTRVGLRFRGRWKRILIWTPLAVLIMVAVQVVCAILMIARGVPGDLTGRTWLRASVRQLSEQAGLHIGPAAMIALVVLSALLGLVVTAIATLGEEIGWRGWLWPALRPLGPVRAAVVGGVIWSLWHLPIVLIGHNYPGEPRWLAVLVFLLPCIAMTLLFGAITDRAGGNPIPSAFAHSALNSLMATIIAIVSVPATANGINLLIDTPIGVTGAVLMFAIGLAVTPWRGDRRLQQEGAGGR